LLDGGLSEVRVRLCELLCSWILRELKSQIASIRKRPQRMVEEVVGLNPELQGLRLRNVEVLEDPEIGVEVSRPVVFLTPGIVNLLHKKKAVVHIEESGEACIPTHLRSLDWQHLPCSLSSLQHAPPCP